MRESQRGEVDRRVHHDPVVFAVWPGDEAVQAHSHLVAVVPAAILAQHPFGQPVKTKHSFAPRVHAFSREIRKAMVEAYAWFVAVFRDAAEKLRRGERMARFPEGSFPPGLPFVRGCLPSTVS